MRWSQVRRSRKRRPCTNQVSELVVSLIGTSKVFAHSLQHHNEHILTHEYINSHSRFRGVHFGLDFTALALEYNESISGSPALNLILIFLRNRVDFSLEIRYFARWWKIFCNDYSLSAWQRIRFIVACCLLSREKDNKWWWMLSRLLVSEREYAEETTASLGGSKYSASSKNTPHHWLSELYTHPRFFRVFTDSIVAT